VLVLAGLDPSGGAGLLADAEAVRAAGARPLCVATALTVQTTRRARSFQPCAPTLVQESARALLEEEDVRAVKLGMLAEPRVARAIADLLDGFPTLPLLVDPVLAASSGALLFKGSPEAAREAVASLWGRALLTPNGPEAGLLLGWPKPPVDAEGQERAARALLQAGAGAVLVKGGHVEGPESVDLLATRAPGGQLQLERLTDPRLQARARGTGCRLASATAAGLARGLPLLASVRQAKELVRQYIVRCAEEERADHPEAQELAETRRP
jgi:hydroxymethylpyrimidine/phosphomethylpyrimidine kinase